MSITLLSFIPLFLHIFLAIPLMVVMYQIVKAIHHIYIYIYMPVYLSVKFNTRMSLKQSTFYDVENSTSLVGLEPTISGLHSINSHHVSDHQSNAFLIYFYISGALNQEFVYGNDKNMNCRCPMAAILNFTICGKMVPFTAWHTAEMDSAEKMHIETTNEVLFLKNAYRSLSRAISKIFVLTIKLSQWGPSSLRYYPLQGLWTQPNL